MKSGGHVTAAALALVLASTTLMWIAHGNAMSPLRQAESSHCRLRARWAAESAVAHALGRRGPVQARLDQSTQYRAMWNRGRIEARGEAACRDQKLRYDIAADFGEGDIVRTWYGSFTPVPE